MKKQLGELDGYEVKLDVELARQLRFHNNKKRIEKRTQE
jgi:hypothetical protein